MALRAIVTMLCGVGLYASLFMLRKGGRGRAGRACRAQRGPNAPGAPLRGRPQRLVRRLILPGARRCHLASPLDRSALLLLFVPALTAAGDVRRSGLLVALCHANAMRLLLDLARGQLGRSRSAWRSLNRASRKLRSCVLPRP